jgi:hypothetical protein
MYYEFPAVSASASRGHVDGLAVDPLAGIRRWQSITVMVMGWRSAKTSGFFIVG